MATPFLVARERDLGPGRTETYVGIILAVAFASPPILDALLASFAWSEALRDVVKAVTLLLLVMATMLMLLRWQARAQRLLKDLAPEALRPEKVLIVRTPADEASGFLIFGQFVSQLTVRVYVAAQRLTARIAATATRRSRRRWAVAGRPRAKRSSCTCSSSRMRRPPTAACPAGWSTLALGGFFASMLLLTETLVLLVPVFGAMGATAPLRILVAFLTWPTIVILSLFLVLPFGIDVALANILLDVTAETTPTGSWTVHMFPAPTAGNSAKTRCRSCTASSTRIQRAGVHRRLDRQQEEVKVGEVRSVGTETRRKQDAAMRRVDGPRPRAIRERLVAMAFPGKEGRVMGQAWHPQRGAGRDRCLQQAFAFHSIDQSVSPAGNGSPRVPWTPEPPRPARARRRL